VDAIKSAGIFVISSATTVAEAKMLERRGVDDACTIVTDTITGRPARYIRNKLTDDLIASGLKPVAFPAQLSLTAPLGATGDRELTALFAGQSAALARDTTAAELVHSLAEGDDQAPSRYERMNVTNARSGTEYAGDPT